MKVHEMIIVAIERDWHVIEKHIDSIHDLIADVIREGIAAGEFRRSGRRRRVALLRRGDDKRSATRKWWPNVLPRPTARRSTN
jgi:hypothetical protein